MVWYLLLLYFGFPLFWILCGLYLVFAYFLLLFWVLLIDFGCFELVACFCGLFDVDSVFRFDFDSAVLCGTRLANFWFILVCFRFGLLCV